MRLRKRPAKSQPVAHAPRSAFVPPVPPQHFVLDLDAYGVEHGVRKRAREAAAAEQLERDIASGCAVRLVPQDDSDSD